MIEKTVGNAYSYCMKPSIYLDYNATVPLRPSAYEILMEVHKQVLNASAAHSHGQKGRLLIEKARAVIAQSINCPTEGIIFNSGATESNNTILQHFAKTYPDERILIGATEHAAVQEVIQNVERIPVDANGVIDLNALEAFFKEERRVSLVSIMLANNETGTIQPMKEISTLVHKHGALLHSDAIQGFGKIPIDMADMGIDFLSLSAHKNGGTQGCGALAMRLCGETPVLLYGGGQEKGARGGTENISGIAAFGASTAESMEKLDSEYQRLKALQIQLEQGILSISPQSVIFSQKTERLPNTTLFSTPGLKAETLVMRFDLEGIAVSNGAACSSGTVKQSRVLGAMGVDEQTASGAIRVSTGWQTTEDEIDVFLNTFETIYTQMQGRMNG